MTSFYLFLEGICNYLIYDEKDLLKISLFFSSICFMINIFVTLALKPSLEDYINSYTGSRPPVVRNNSEIKNEIISENKDLIIPKFLEKFSNTYFKKAIGKKVNEDKENKKNMKIIPKNLKKKEGKLKLNQQKGNLYLKTTKKSFSTNYLLNQSFSPSQNKIQINFNNKQTNNNLDKIDEDLVEITDENRKNELKNSIPKIDFEENRNFFQSKPKSSLNSPSLKTPKISPNTPKLINNEHKENPENEINIIVNKKSCSKKMIHIKSKSYLKKNPSENIFSLPNSNILQKEGEYFIRVIEEPINELNEEKEVQIVKCHICYDNLSDAVIMDCGHGGICYDCALKIWKKKGICYLCREKIVQLLQIDINEKSGNFLKVISSTQLKIEVKEYDVNEPLPEGARDNGDVIEIDSYHSITIDQNEMDRNEDAFIVRQENIKKHLK